MIALAAVAAALTLAAPDLPPPGLVDGPTAKALADRGVRVVDVRTPAEFEAGHVPGAVNVPYDQVPARAAELGPADRPLVLYCRTGHRSGIAVEALKKLGYTALYDMRAFTSWPGPLATGPASQPPPAAR